MAKKNPSFWKAFCDLKRGDFELIKGFKTGISG